MTEQEYIKSELSPTPFVACDLKVGDIVTYTNDYGVSFHGRKVTGFSDPKTSYHPEAHIHLAKDAYWFPVKESSLSKTKKSIDK